MTLQSDTHILTGPNFFQMKIGNVLVTPLGGVQATLAATLANPVSNTLTVTASPTYTTTVTPWFYVHGNVAGTVTSGQAFFNQFSFDSDTVNASGASGGGAVGYYFGHALSAGAVGGRTTFQSFFDQQGITTSAADQYYASHSAFSQAAFSAGGIAGAGNARGNLFAANDSSLLKTGAGLYWNALVGREVDVGVQTGVAVAYKYGLSVVQWASDAVRGTLDDAAFMLGSQSAGTAPGWLTGLQFGSKTGWWPIASTGTLIGTAAGIGGGPTMAAANAMDFSAITLSGYLLKGPSSNFTVTGSGLVGIGIVTPVAALSIKDTAAPTLVFGQLGGNNALAGIGITTSGSSAQVSAGNYVLLADGASTLVNATTSISLSLSNSEYFGVANTGVNVTGVYKVATTQVVGARDTGWTAMTGSPDKVTVYATGTVTLAQLAGRVAQLQATLTTHGLIGT